MWLETYFRFLTETSTRRRSTRGGSPATRLRVEPLEDRNLPSFSMPVDHGSNLSPQAVMAADFSGDGRADLLAVEYGTASVLLSNGDGTFQAPRTLGTPVWVRGAADLNDDGKADLVTITAGGNAVNMLLSNGDGSFQLSQSVSLPSQPSSVDPGLILLQYPDSVTVGDFNGDGKVDLVVGGVTEYWPNNGDAFPFLEAYANALLGNGDGTFRLASVKRLPGSVSPLYPGDFNNDGRLDVLHYTGVFRGNGDGTFQDPVGTGYVFCQQVGDFNGNGNLDLLTDDRTGGGPSLQFGNGDGTFQPARRFGPDFTWHSTVAGDVNADGILDVVVLTDVAVYDAYGIPYESTRTAQVLLGTGDGRFSQSIAADFGTVAGHKAYTAAVLADVDADGFLDLAATETEYSAEGGSGNRGVHVAINGGVWPFPPLQPSIKISDATVVEGNTGTRPATFTVTLDAAYSLPVTVTYTTANWTASAGSDYLPVSGTLTFAPGETTKTIPVPVVGDRLGESHEPFLVYLSSPTNATIADGQGVGTIVDDEPRISITDVTKVEGKKGTKTQFTFTVTLSAAYDQPVTMSFRTADGTATTGNSDYVAKTGTLTFAPGETTKTITIEVKGDSKREANEAFYLDLFGLSSNALLTKSRGLGTILNDD